MAEIIVFANQKGGVGKTTCAVNIAAGLGLKGKKTLLVDCDPQSNSTSALGIHRKRISKTVYDILISACAPADAVIVTGFKNLSLLPSSPALTGAEYDLSDLPDRQFRLRDALKEISDGYDYILIDCPPSLGMLTLNALCASNGVVIPMQCEYFALEGLSQIISTVNKVKKLYNPTLCLIGIIFTMYNGRLNLSLQIVDEIKRFYADRLFATPVPRSVRLSEAPSHGKPIQYYDRFSKGSESYNEIVTELLSRTNQ